MESTKSQRPSIDDTATDPHIPDKIFLSNYVREIEIGAYREEFGVAQKVRFDITVEVAGSTTRSDDRVGSVINYDGFVQAIADLAEGPRFNLLETFAERLADAILVDPRALSATIRIEKIDRLPGDAGLGVEIVRRANKSR